MTATPAEPPGRRAALRHIGDVLRLCLTGRPRRSVLGYASAGGHHAALARWRALPSALAQILRLTCDPDRAAEWVLTRERGGWAVRPAAALDGPAVYATSGIPADDQNAAFDWASEVTPDTPRKGVRYAGPPPL